MATKEFSAVFESKAVQDLLDKVNRNYRKTETRSRDYVVGLSAFVFRDIVDHFAKEKSPKGSWDSWSNQYQKKMDRLGKSGNNILQDSGMLRQRIAPIEKGRNFRRTGNAIVWYNNAKTKKGFAYAGHHDAGRSSYKGNPRSFMWLSDKAFDQIAGYSLDFLLEGK